VVRFSLRILALILGFIGVVVAFIVNLLYSSLQVMGRVSGVVSGPSHFLFGMLVILIGLIGSVLAVFAPIVGGVLLAVAGIAFFFIAGWWALFASPFLLIAAVLAFEHYRTHPQAAG
jgi:hypothetical protein